MVKWKIFLFGTVIQPGMYEFVNQLVLFYESIF
jgi:hypothetical protein